MYYALVFLLGTLISWVSLIIIIPIAQKMAEFSMPPWSETLWKLAAVSAAGNLVSLFIGPYSALGSWAVGGVVFWFLMWRWFDMDVFGAIVVTVISWVVRAILGMMLFGALHALQ